MRKLLEVSLANAMPSYKIQEKSSNKNINDVLTKLLRSGEGCYSIEGVNVTQNERHEFIFKDGNNHDDSDLDEE